RTHISIDISTYHAAGKCRPDGFAMTAHAAEPIRGTSRRRTRKRSRCILTSRNIKCVPNKTHAVLNIGEALGLRTHFAFDAKRRLETDPPQGHQECRNVDLTATQRHFL